VPPAGIGAKLGLKLRAAGRDWRRIVLRTAVGLTLMVVGVGTVPHQWCSRFAGGGGASRWWEGDIQSQTAIARGVEQWVTADLGREDFTTGSSKFDGEWLFGTYMMAVMGLGQTALEHPELKGSHLPLIDHCIERILSEEVRAFDREAWGDDPIESLDGESHHAAYLGYLNLALSLRRLLGPESPSAEINDRITAALARRIGSSKIMLMETYRSEVYPVDNCAVVGSIGLYDRATGADHSELIRRWVGNCRKRCVDPETGLLYQCVSAWTGEAIDEPRGSGTTLGLYFLSFADRDFSRELFGAVQRSLAGNLFGFGAVREYPRGVTGTGDIDSGPIVFGYGISPTGFSLAGSRMYGDRELFGRAYASAVLWGAPLERKGRFEFVTGGPIGNALLFAMLTAQPELPEPPARTGVEEAER